MDRFAVAIGKVDRFSLTHQFSLEASALPMAHIAPVFPARLSKTRKLFKNMLVLNGAASPIGNFIFLSHLRVTASNEVAF